MSYLNQFLNVLEVELPEICSDKDLVEQLPDIFKSLSIIHRMRYRGQTPPYFSIEPNIYYLKGDVLSWLKSRYNTKNDSVIDKSQISCAR